MESLIEILNKVNRLPANAFEAMILNYDNAAFFCQRWLIPEKIWVKLWAENHKDDFCSTALVERHLTPGQIKMCIDEVVKNPELARYFLRHNPIPKSHANKLEFPITELGLPGLMSILLNGTYSVTRSKKILLSLKDDSVFEMRADYGILKLFWYAIRAGRETPNSEIEDFLATHFAEDTAFFAHYGGFYSDAAAREALSFLLSKRPTLGSMLNRLEITDISEVFVSELLDSEAARYVSAEAINKYYNMIISASGLKEAEEQLKGSNCLGAAGFTPGQIPDDFAARLPSSSPLLVDCQKVTVDLVETFANKTVTFEDLNNTRGFTGFLRIFCAYSGLFDTQELNDYQVDDNASGSTTDERFRSVFYEDAILNKNDEAFLAKLLKASPSKDYGFSFAYGAIMALKDASVLDWNLFFTVGKHHQGPLDKLLKAMDKLS